MDAYPGDLLTGVFPLAFAVDAILPSEDADDDHDEDGNLQEQQQQRQKSTRSLFDRFLDSIASQLTDPTSDESFSKSRNIRKVTSGADAFTSLLRGTEEPTMSLSATNFDDVESSDEEEDLMSQDSNSSRRFRMGIGSPSTLTMTRMTKHSSSPRHAESTSYAKSLKLDGFFQRARIISISGRHGFPPSKDATGQSNFAIKLAQARSALAMNPTNANAIRLKRVMDQHPMDGILPSGWLEKHAAALPSVILLVTKLQFDNYETQQEQDAHVLQTLAQLRESLASKRDCAIRIVCLADLDNASPTTPAKVDEWISRMKRDSNHTAAAVSLLQLPLEDAGDSEVAHLYTQIRDDSWTYYQHLCRRAKRKLQLLGHDAQPTLLPLAVRYCFKIGVYYEFLLKHTKALRYFADAYAYLQTYYKLLMEKSLTWNPVQTTEISNDDDGNIEISASNTHADNHVETSGVEVALVDSSEDDDDDDDNYHDNDTAVHIPLDIRKIFTELHPPFDMAHQCRAVADWLNFKLVQAGLQSAVNNSHNKNGILAASAQWRRHAQVFLQPQQQSSSTAAAADGGAADGATAATTGEIWNYWRYVAQQRHTMAQLVERFPVVVQKNDEVMHRCSPWRNYMAAAEAQMRLAQSLLKATTTTLPVPVLDKEAALRGQFVGGLTTDGLQPILEEESKRNHRDAALGMLQRAISHFEREYKISSQNDENDEEVVHRCGARLYYLAGGVLFGRMEHKEAIPYLEKAVKYAQGWKGLELGIRRMLIECYEKHMPASTGVAADIQRSETIASMILDSYFNSKMSSRNLRRALDNFSSLSGGGMMKWHRTCLDESDSSLPFSFAVTFPGATHATAGDTATASVMIRSNLDYAVHINSITLLSMAGRIPVQQLVSAQNANEGIDGGIIIQAKTSILFAKTPLDVPKDLDVIATDEAGNGGEKEGTAGKGSFAKSARPRTAGVTSAAGARLIEENRFEDGPSDRSAQWSVRFLGGKPLRCDGLCLVFYPVHAEKAGGVGNVSLIELTIEKQQPKTAANIKRTPFEGDNYLSSAWSRPYDLPLAQGPRCLRVLPPLPQMVVENLSDALTGGKTVEGTVNRILLQLKAGPNEFCEDIKYTVKCGSMLLSLDGSTRHLNMEDCSDKKKNEEETRIPSLVYHNNRGDDSIVSTNFGYNLPRGWKLLGEGRGTTAPVSTPVSTLKGGEETFFFFDVYRPHRSLPPMDDLNETGSKRSSDGGVVDSDQLCQTDFDVKITYKQTRPTKGGVQNRRRRRKPTVATEEQGDGADKNDDGNELVSLDYTGTVIWASPLSMDFDAVHVTQKAPPSGRRHASNAMGEEEKKKDDADNDFELSIADGERVTTRCTLWANETPNDIGIDISRVWFKEKDDTEKEPECEFVLVGDKGSGTLFEPTEKDVCHTLGKAKKMAVMLTVKASHKNKDTFTSPLSTHIGILGVDWTPRPLAIPPEAAGIMGKIQGHGPLSLTSNTIYFRGPACCIERAPFSTSMSIQPSAPRVGMPFEVLYTIVNQTNVHQQVSVECNVASDVLVAGSTRGDFFTSPMATQVLTYTVIATKAGKVMLPTISISSQRYNTWLVSKEAAGAMEIYVLP